MKRRDGHLEYLRGELRACELRLRALRQMGENREARRQLVEREGDVRASAMFASLADVGAGFTAEAIRENLRVQAMFRELIAEHLARTARERVEPIRATNDDAALFELLKGVGGRMPEGPG